MAVFIEHLKKRFSVGRIFSEREYIQGENIAYRSFSENRKSYTGFYIDIGTHHPYPFSNTLHFSQKGWQKITIEPTSESANLFNLFSNTGMVINTEQGAKHESSMLYYLKNRKTSGSTIEIAKKSIATFNTVIKTVNVREKPLAAVLDNNLPAGQTIDFLSLDAAGFDMRALKSIDWTRYIPLFIIIKVNAGIQGGAAPICSFLMQKNYKQVAKTDRAYFFKYSGK